VIALVKSSHIIVATDLAHIRLSARNQIEGIIEHIERGAVNALVSINAGEGVCLTAGITIQSAENLDLHPGQRATAIFKAGSVILGVLV
jgi:molybdate transport system regulatory protein